MKAVYPIVISEGEKYYVVYIPDFNINTQGKDMAESIEMARDAIGLMGIDMEDDNETIPSPSAISSVEKENETDIVTLVDVDFSEYRRKHETHTVKKNCTLPAWLHFEAEKAGVNYSAILQEALKRELHITNR